MPISKKCAVLLCRFQDTMTEPVLPVAYFQKLFLGVGNGSLDDYWKDVSLGQVNLSGTRIFGWSDLPITLASLIRDFEKDRLGRMRKVLSFFSNIKESDYHAIIVIFNGEADSGASGKAIWASKNRVRSHTFLAHEMGHSLFDFDHSFDLSNRRNSTWGSIGAYFDKFDLMSAMNVHTTPKTIRYEANKSETVAIGPRLCAFYPLLQKWIPNSRVRHVPVISGNTSFSEQITLVSMSHAERSGLLCADLGDFLVEFRTKEGWDANIPESCILIHGIKANTSGKKVPWIICPNLSSPNLQHWLATQRWKSNVNFEHFRKGGLCVSVDRIDSANHTATITVSYTPPPLFTNFKLTIENSGNHVIVKGSFDITGWNNCNAPHNVPYNVRIKLRGSDNALRGSDDTEYEFPLIALRDGSDSTPSRFTFVQRLPKGVLDEDEGHGLVESLRRERDKDEIYAVAKIDGFDGWAQEYHSNTVEGWF